VEARTRRIKDQAHVTLRAAEESAYALGLCHKNTSTALRRKPHPNYTYIILLRQKVSRTKRFFSGELFGFASQTSHKCKLVLRVRINRLEMNRAQRRIQHKPDRSESSSPDPQGPRGIHPASDHDATGDRPALLAILSCAILTQSTFLRHPEFPERSE